MTGARSGTGIGCNDLLGAADDLAETLKCVMPICGCLHPYCQMCEGQNMAEESIERFKSAREVAGWQPIETAPKDESVLIIANGGMLLGYFDTVSECWKDSASRSLGPDDVPVTHWMRLPAPPNANNQVRPDDA